MTREQALAALGRAVLSTDPDITASYGFDQSRFTGRAVPSAVLAPSTTDEVVSCLRVAAEQGWTVVPRGAGSGLSGAANGDADTVVLSTHRMNSIVSIDTVERLAVVQPGVVTGELRTAVAERGLFYPPDPGSVAISTIGGNVATDAGGMCCVKYGVTGDFVLGLEVVLADGRVMRTGRRTAKGVAGYDLTHLFVGSEGTLGVVTEITVRLLPAPREPLTLVATFGSLAAAGEAVAAITASGVSVSMLEIMDRTTLRAVDRMTRMGFDDDVAAMLLVQSDASDAAAALAEVEKACAATAVDVVIGDDPAEGAQLLEARRQALPALERLGDWLLDDVCVPRSRIVELIGHIETVAADEQLTIGVFGHAGDGNMHPTIIYDESDPASRAGALRAFDRITGHALELGGTITGEHGVGRLKKSWLARELDETAMAVHRAVRAAFDPEGRLNPGNLF
ncbi:FAD-linked oxidase C-terminal domain-containing protein [Nocardia sp. NPDC052254]|uniref:FAD-binding oxidoreductase n=1 Tax=Nocardia sp. NPDC052254 TaxID=3155681 RepID=UPI00341EA2BC